MQIHVYIETKCCYSIKKLPNKTMRYLAKCLNRNIQNALNRDMWSATIVVIEDTECIAYYNSDLLTVVDTKTSMIELLWILRISLITKPTTKNINKQANTVLPHNSIIPIYHTANDLATVWPNTKCRWLLWHFLLAFITTKCSTGLLLRKLSKIIAYTLTSLFFYCFAAILEQQCISLYL